MSAVIQITSINGNVIENARWQVKDISNLKDGHSFQICFTISDDNVIEYIKKANATGYHMDQTEDSQYVVLSFLVKQIRHMFDIKELNIDSMAILVPVNRTIENLLMYILSPDQCDPRFIKLIGPAP